jgi:hypothetical protein
MSSILIIRQATAIHMITDGASYTPDGILMKISTKVVSVPSLNAAVYSRGPDHTAQLAAAGMARFQSFDELVDGLEDFAPDFYRRNEDIYSQTEYKEAELFVCGWSEERRAPEGYIIRLCPPTSEWNEALPSWQIEKPGSYAAPANAKQKLSALCAAPSASESDMRAALFPFPFNVEDLNPKIDGLHMFEIQRRKLSERADQPTHYSIGGLCLLTSIGRNEIKQSVLARYKDRIGEMIQPEEIDWAEWRAKAEGKPSAGGLSRLKSSMARRKERKLQRV